MPVPSLIQLDAKSGWFVRAIKLLEKLVGQEWSSVVGLQGYLTLQADNTCREVKNGIVMRLMAALVSDGVILSDRMSFLRSGHSHEDVDQLFGSASTWMKNRVRSALASEDFLIALSSFRECINISQLVFESFATSGSER